MENRPTSSATKVVRQTGVSRRKRLSRALRWVGLIAVVTTVVWIAWAESHPRAERALRSEVRAQLLEWFPQHMDFTSDGWHGLFDLTPVGVETRGTVVLVHGLDEPGSIWEDVIPALREADWAVWEFHYPNDQPIEASAAYLASVWAQLGAGEPVFLPGSLKAAGKCWRRSLRSRALLV